MECEHCKKVKAISDFGWTDLEAFGYQICKECNAFYEKITGNRMAADIFHGKYKVDFR